MHYTLPEEHLFNVIIQLCRFFIEFSTSFGNQLLCFLHPKVFNCVTQTAIKNIPLTITQNFLSNVLEKDKDILSRIGILNEFQKYNLFCSKLLLFKSPKKNFRNLDSENQKTEEIVYAFEIPEDINEEDFETKMNKLKKKNLSVKEYNKSVTSFYEKKSIDHYKDQISKLKGLEDLDFLVQDPKDYFYKRWIWIIFPWACLNVNKSENFSNTIEKFNFRDTEYLSSRIFYFLIESFRRNEIKYHGFEYSKQIKVSENENFKEKV